MGIISIMLFWNKNSKKEYFSLGNNYTLAGAIITLENELKELNTKLNNIIDNISKIYDKTELSNNTTPVSKLYESIILLLPSIYSIIDSGISQIQTTDSTTSVQSNYITNTSIKSDARFTDYKISLTILNNNIDSFLKNKNTYLDIITNQDINALSKDTKNIVNELNSLSLPLSRIKEFITSISA
jgi:hypothetical protein